MRTLLIGILSGLVVGLGCGPDTGSDDDDDCPDLILCTPDSGPSDATPPVCDLLLQTGCAAGEKCTKYRDGVGAYPTTCAPDGILAIGETCDTPPAGVDNCAAGGFCVNGTCAEICTLDPDSCGDGEGCSTYTMTFTGLDGFGLCDDRCDLIAQDCEEDEGCYLHIESGDALCNGIPEPALGLEQDELCYGPAPGECYVNGCDAGFQGLLGESIEDTDRDRCAAFCTPSPTHSEATENAGGIFNGGVGSCADAGAAEHQCRFFNSFFESSEDLPDSIGVCVPVDVWGDCTDYDLANGTPGLFGCVPAS